MENQNKEVVLPLYPVVPILGAITLFGLIAFMEPVEIALSFMFVISGVVWYLVYGRRKADKKGILSQHILSWAETMPDIVVSAASNVQPDGGNYRVMVPLANLEHEKDPIILASAIAKQRGGTVDAVHIVTIPDQTPLAYAADRIDELEENYHAVLDEAERDAEILGVEVRTHTIVSHRSFEEIFNAARTHQGSRSHGLGCRFSWISRPS